MMNTMQNPNYLAALAARAGIQPRPQPLGALGTAGVSPPGAGMVRPASAPVQPATAPTQGALAAAAMQPRMGVPMQRPMGAALGMAPSALGSAIARPGMPMMRPGMPTGVPTAGAAPSWAPAAHFALGGSTLGAGSLGALGSAIRRPMMPGSHMVNSIGSAGHLRMPRIPIAGSMRNIDQAPIARLHKLAAGGMPTAPVAPQAPQEPQLGPEGAQAVGKALQHLQQRNPSGAIQALSDSRQAMGHPLVAAATRHLAAGKNIGAAHAALKHVANQHARGQFARRNASALGTAAQIPAGGGAMQPGGGMPMGGQG